MPGEETRTDTTRSRRAFLKAAALGSAAAAIAPGAAAGQGPSGRRLGAGVSGYGERSRFETALHFERHHAGIPDIDSSAHRLLVDGSVLLAEVGVRGARRPRIPSHQRAGVVGPRPRCPGRGVDRWGPDMGRGPVAGSGAAARVRGTRSDYHNNAIQGWRIARDGAVENVDV